MKGEKFNFYLQKIEQKFPQRNFLNLGEMLQMINISRSTYKRIVDANDLHKLPHIYKKESFKQQGANYFVYKYDVYEIAKFLSEKGEN